MSDNSVREQAVDILQELGLKEYEAKCFVALSRLPQGTAKEISETSDVPRTRVYDAARVLEAKGLVEVQHTNPQAFRAVPIEEATATLEREYSERMAELQDALESMTPAQTRDEGEADNEVWALSDPTAITNRLAGLVETGTDEVILVLGRGQRLEDRLVEAISVACSKGVSVTIATVSEDQCETIGEQLPDVTAFVSEFGGFLERGDRTQARTTRLALVDSDTILVASTDDSQTNCGTEHATIGTGFNNGIVILLRRLVRNRVEPTGN